MPLQGTLGFLGCGNMGGAILKGLLETGTLQPVQAMVFDLDSTRVEDARRLGVVVVDSPRELAERSSTILLAVKPQTMEAVLHDIASAVAPGTLVISIAAGISIAYIQDRLGQDVHVIRVMPNTPAMVGAGAAALASGRNCTDDDKDIARVIFEAIGVAEQVSEDAMDVVTALSGSGPAYFFYMVETLVEAAVAQGLARDQATRLAGQTLYGAGRLLIESGEEAGTLRERVTSKGGTTEAALKTLREQGFPEALSAAVNAAARRSHELGR